MSKKFLNKLVAAILMMAMISTMFLGGVVSAETTEPTATYTVVGSIEEPSDTESYAYVTIESKTPFSAVSFKVVNIVYETNTKIYEGTAISPLKLDSAEYIKSEMANGAAEYVPYVEAETEDAEAVIIEGDGVASGDGDTRDYYTSVTVKLNFTGKVVHWKKFQIALTDIVITDDTLVWTASLGESTKPFIHTCVSYHKSNKVVNDDTHYKVDETYCYFKCGSLDGHLQVDPGMTYLNSEGVETAAGNVDQLRAKAVNISYNDDGTVTLNMYVDNIYMQNFGYNAYQMVICPTDGTKYTRFTGESGQGQEDASIVTGTKLSSDVAAELGFDSSSIYMFSFDNIPAKYVSDDILFTVIGKNSAGKLAYGRTQAYSLKDYCYDVIDGEYDDADKNMCASLLIYGAEAQEYFGVNTGSLATEGLDSAYTTAYENFDIKTDGGAVADVAYESEIADCYVYGTSVIFRANASLKIYFVFDGDYKNNTDICVKFTVDGVTTEVSVSDMQTEGSGKYYAYNMTELGITQLTDVVTVDIYSGEEQLGSGSYSVGGYAIKAAEKGAAVEDLSKSLIYYGNMVKTCYAN